MRKPQGHFLAKISTLASGILLCLPGFFLAAVAVPRLVSGIAVDSAFPATEDIETNFQLSRQAYLQARDALSRANLSDGKSKIAEAEAAHLAGGSVNDILSILIPALAETPASAKGWTLLAELESSQTPKSAAVALGLALDTAPFDYWLSVRRANIGAQLWNALAPEDRNRLLRQTRILWDEQSLRGAIGALIATEPGRTLVQRAFAEDPETLRELDRQMVLRSLQDVAVP